MIFFYICTGGLLLLLSGLEGKNVPSLEALMKEESDLMAKQLELMQTLDEILPINHGLSSESDEAEPKGASNRGPGALSPSSVSAEAEPKRASNRGLGSLSAETKGTNTLTPTSVGENKLVFNVPLDKGPHHTYKFDVKDLMEKAK